jgi:CO/xanthine dehydrogenase Mo-binding subunit
VRYLVPSPLKSAEIKHFRYFRCKITRPLRRSKTLSQLQKYGVGQPVRRKEGRHAGRGKGKYTDDFSLPRPGLCLDRALQPSPWHLRGIDTKAAATMPGRARRLDRQGPGSRRLQPLHLRPAAEEPATARRCCRPTVLALATDKVRFVGDPVAFVVAETLAQARDAAEAVELDIEPLPAVTDARRPQSPARRSSTITSRTTSRSTITMATAPRSMRRSPAQRT